MSSALFSVQGSFAPAASPRAPNRSGAKARHRVAFVALFAAVAAFSSLAAGTTPEDAGELALELGRASGGVVRPVDVRWEPSEGMLADLVVGRFALFLASASPGGPRDVYRARVRLSPEGHPLAVSGLRNLT